jgi:hypothetical protein
MVGNYSKSHRGADATSHMDKTQGGRNRGAVDFSTTIEYWFYHTKHTL